MHLCLGMSHSAKWTCYPLRFLAGDAVRRARALKMCSITRRKATSVLLPPGCSSPSCNSSGTFGESTSCFSRSTPGYKSPGYIGVPGCCLLSNSCSSPSTSSPDHTGETQICFNHCFGSESDFCFCDCQARSYFEVWPMQIKFQEWERSQDSHWSNPQGVPSQPCHWYASPQDHVLYPKGSHSKFHLHPIVSLARSRGLYLSFCRLPGGN